MRQLSGTDAFHVLEESRDQHMHTLKIAILDPAAVGAELDLATIRAWAAERLVHVPPLRWRLVHVPYKLARPVWVDTDELDLDYHVTALTLPAPGGEAEFDEAVSQVASTQLSRHHPLWQLTVVDGLSGGKVALVFKLHHAIMDGGASVHFLETVFDTDGGPTVTPQPAPHPAPSRLDLLRFAARHQVGQWQRFPSLVRRTVVATKDNRARKANGDIPVTNPLTAPSTRFERPLHHDRIYADLTVPFDEVARVKNALQCTVNDLFVAVCGGALRRYLLEKGELPDIPLTATAPVSLRGPDELERYGNSTSIWAVSLATDVEDPLERLAAVRRSVSAAREWAQGDKNLLAVWQDHYSLFKLLVVKVRPWVERFAKRPLFNAIVSNVRGPRPLSLHGVPVVAVRSMGPIVGTQGINLTAWSYRENFSVGMHACRVTVPDLRHLADLVAEEFDTYCKVADEVSSRQS